MERKALTTTKKRELSQYHAYAMTGVFLLVSMLIGRLALGTAWFPGPNGTTVAMSISIAAALLAWSGIILEAKRTKQGRWAE